MFVRKKRNKSGSFSIQIIDKSSGSYRVVKTVGFSKDPIKLEYLWRKAHYLIPELIGQSTLNLFCEEDNTIHNFFHESHLKVRVTGPEQILGKIFDKVGFDQIDDKLFRHLVITRLVYPGSKLKTIDYLARYNGISLQVDQLYRFLDKLNHMHKPELERLSFEYTKKVLRGNLGVVFYDMTTLYFEASDEDDFRKTGFSKDGKHQNPQIYLSLLVGKNGYPIGYELFEGGIYEGHTLIPIIKRFEEKFGLQKPIIIADAGLLSNENIKALEESSYKYILGGRIKNESGAVKQQILALELSNQGHSVINKGKGQRLIISYKQTRARKDLHNRERGLKRLEEKVKKGKLSKEHINNRGYNKYLKLEGKISIEIDYDKFKKDAQWDGLKGYVTNSKLTPKTVIENYNNLWHIEKAFRISKTDLKIRPIYHRIRGRIEAHISISFAAYTIYKELERILYKKNAPFSAHRATELTQTMYSLDYSLPNSKKQESVNIALDSEQKILLDIFS